MFEEEVVSVEIDSDGKLCVMPTSREFSYIYRAAREVGWDHARRCLLTPTPREWTHSQWFRQIVDAVAQEYGVRLVLTERTVWTNVADAMRAAIADQCVTVRS